MVPNPHHTHLKTCIHLFHSIYMLNKPLIDKHYILINKQKFKRSKIIVVIFIHGGKIELRNQRVQNASSHSVMVSL